MFLNKVYDQKVELLRAVFRNMYLKEKCDYLDSECKMLAENILSSQVIKAEKNEVKTLLEKELDDLKKLNDQKIRELALANEQIVSLSLILENTKSSVLNSFSENKSMAEELEVKNDMITCLQAELVHVRLDAAEQWVLLRELKQIKNDLERDKEVLSKTKPETISRLQEELMEAKLLETQYALEFDNIKKHLTQMKKEIETHKNDNTINGKQNVGGVVKISKKGALWRNYEKPNLEVTELEEDIKKLGKEKSYLQSKIPELQSKIEILNKHIQFKEAEKSRLQEKLDNAKVKYQSTENITLERKRQYDHLQNSASEKVCAIRNSSKEKKQKIQELTIRLKEISQRRESYTKILKLKESSTIQALEDEIMILETRISQLRSEASILYSPVYSNKNRNGNECIS